nr:hypothetical protein [Tanacetum cinerariifolium]
MANLSEDIQCAGFDAQPPMLDRTDFASWKQHIRLYCRGKENGVNIFKLIDEGPFHMGTFRETLIECEEGALHLGPERARVYFDLSPEDKERFTKLINEIRNIKMTMPRMQLNSKFVNNMLPEWGRFVTALKLNRGLKESNYDQLYAYLKQHEAHANENKMMLKRFTRHTVDPLTLMSNVSPQQYFSQSSPTPPSTHLPPVTYQPYFADNTQLDSGLSPMDNLIKNLTNTLALLTQSYKTYLPQTNNQLKTPSNTRNQATVQDGGVVVQNVQGQQNRGQGNNARGTSAASNGGAQNRVGNVNPGQAMQIKCYNCNVLDEEQLLFIVGGQDNDVDEDVDEPPIQDLALKVYNAFQADECDAFDSGIDEAPTAQTMFMANLSSVDPVYDKVDPSYDLDILSKTAQCVSVKAQTKVVDASLPAELATYKEQVELKCDEIERKNLLIANDNLIVDCLSKEVFYIATNSELNVSRFTEMHDAHTVVQACCLELEAELSKLNDKIQKDDHNELVKRFSNLEALFVAVVFHEKIEYMYLRDV